MPWKQHKKLLCCPFEPGQRLQRIQNRKHLYIYYSAWYIALLCPIQGRALARYCILSRVIISDSKFAQGLLQHIFTGTKSRPAGCRSEVPSVPQSPLCLDCHIRSPHPPRLNRRAGQLCLRKIMITHGSKESHLNATSAFVGRLREAQQA